MEEIIRKIRALPGVIIQIDGAIVDAGPENGYIPKATVLMILEGKL